MSPSSTSAPAPAPLPPWHADGGDGTYRNPVLFLDVPDPDVVRVGDEFFLVCSTFSHEPGLLLLRSPDLVNWTWAGAALPHLGPADFFSHPQRGCGVWAPALRHHAGRFWIFYPDPDHGLFAVTAADFGGPWTEPVLVKAGRGLIDPCPLWDDDGQAYLIHGWAKSRAGFNNVLTLHRMAADGSRVLDAGRVVIDGADFPGCHTLEGPKLYRRDGWYYVFAPAGGVATGWQSVFRARTPWGPYEERRVLAQGSTAVNGPHQGAWIEDAAGASWFVHFQDRGPFGRIGHLQPMRWIADWPVIGHDPAGTGCGEPVARHAKPAASPAGPSAGGKLVADGFGGPELAPWWQWEARHERDWYALDPQTGGLRLFTQQSTHLWSAPNVVSQRAVGPASTVTTELIHRPQSSGERAGLVVLGRDYTWIGLRQTPDGPRLVRATCRGADTGARDESETAGPLVPAGRVQLRVRVIEAAPWSLSYSLDEGRTWTELGERFAARPGIWVGARLGVFALAPVEADTLGQADFSWWRITP